MTTNESEGLNSADYLKRIVEEGIFVKEDFSLPEIERLITLVINSFLPQVEQLLNVPKPIMNEQAVNFLTKFRKSYLEKRGLGVALACYDVLVNVVGKKDAERVVSAVEDVRRAFKNADEKLQIYKTILSAENKKLEDDVTSGVSVGGVLTEDSDHSPRSGSRADYTEASFSGEKH